MGIPEGAIELAMVDEADAYEVDEAYIYYHPASGKFFLQTATGCSCWDGEYETEEYDSLLALETALIDGDRTYNPSLNGAKTLLAESKQALSKMGIFI
jgi:hypothetical protein